MMAMRVNRRWLLRTGMAAAGLSGWRAAAAQKSNVQTVDAAGLKKVLQSYRGKVVLVNLWATWCPPCVEEFPDLVKLHNQYQSQGLVVLAVSLDEPEDRAKVVAFAERQKATGPVVVRKSGDVEKFVNAISRDWTGAVPTTYVFDRKGKLSGAPVVGQRSYEQFVALVQPLLR